MCLTAPQRSFNKHNDVMGSSFFTAFAFLFSSEQLSYFLELKLSVNVQTHSHTVSTFMYQPLTCTACSTHNVLLLPSARQQSTQSLSFWIVLFTPDQNMMCKQSHICFQQVSVSPSSFGCLIEFRPLPAHTLLDFLCFHGSTLHFKCAVTFSITVEMRTAIFGPD